MRHSDGLRAAAGSRAITLVNTSFIQTSNVSSITDNKPTNTSENDLLIAILANANLRTMATTGWTTVLDNGRIHVSYKIAGASEPSTYTWTPTPGGVRGCLLICTYRNAAYDTIGTASTTASGTTQTAPAITLTSSGSTLFAVFMAATVTSLSYSNQTSGLNAFLVDSDALSPSMTVYTQANVPSGSTGNKSADASNVPTGPACVLFGIKPS